MFLPTAHVIEFFLNWQIWHFCHSCTKLTSRAFKISKRNCPPLGIEVTTPTPTIRIPAALPIPPQRHLLNRRFMNWTWINSGSIEHDFIRVWKFETGMDWQIGWVGKVTGILIVGLVLWVQYPVEAIFFYWFWNPVMLILYKNDRNVRSVNLGKTWLRGKVMIRIWLCPQWREGRGLIPLCITFGPGRKNLTSRKS